MGSTEFHGSIGRATQLIVRLPVKSNHKTKNGSWPPCEPVSRPRTTGQNDGKTLSMPGPIFVRCSRDSDFTETIWKQRRVFMKIKSMLHATSPCFFHHTTYFHYPEKTHEEEASRHTQRIKTAKAYRSKECIQSVEYFFIDALR